ncbi:unnamed protein product [Chrysoparadoxa australica]
MHPPLHRPHPTCQEVIKALIECHESNPYAKFWGTCNDQKRALDKCFAEEKEVKRKENYEKGMKTEAAWLERKRMLEEAAAMKASDGSSSTQAVPCHGRRLSTCQTPHPAESYSVRV